MTTSARRAEADRATTAFHVALTQIGVATVEEALVLWDDVPPARRGPQAGAWLTRAIHMVMTRRRMSRDLARAYYRLARALHTGRTVPDPRDPEPRTVLLSDLRREFTFLAEGQAPDQPPEPKKSAESVEPAPDGDSEDDEADRILIEELKGLDQDDEDARLDREAERELRVVLDALGPENLDRQVRDIDDEAPAKEVDRARDAAHFSAGARQAAATARVAMNGARGELWSKVAHDLRVLGWARLSATGTPCGWCAMLISRGAVYKTQTSAQTSDGDLYHDNCHCFAVPIFAREQFTTGELFALNRKYAKEWPHVTRGLSGKAALSAWRRYIRTEQKAAAQVARRPPDVQEA